MLGVGLLILIGIWAVVGFLLWRRLIRPRLRSWLALAFTTVVAALVWFVGPIADELLGARQFRKLCEEMPPVEFSGAVAIGPGAFFDESGRPRWRNGDEFSAIRRETKEWERIFATRQESAVVNKWPFPIVELKTTDYERATGRPVVISRFRGAAGGWMKRVTSWGSVAPYQCHSKGTFPESQTWIRFERQ